MHRIGFILPQRFQLMCLSMVSVFEMVNLKHLQDAYQVDVLSEGERVTSSFGLDVATHRLSTQKYDTVIVGGSPDTSPTTVAMKDYLNHAAETSTRLASVCRGAFMLGDAGLLDGCKATTHWAYTDELKRRFPKAKVHADQIYTEDGKTWTSAGMTAALDLALAFVERDLGRDVAREVAKSLVLERRRFGGQGQSSVLLELDPRSDRVQEALKFARANIRRPLTVASLADAAKVSTRQFTRIFRDETGRSPAKAIESIRLDMARSLTEQTNLPFELIVRDTGFGDRERMRRAFVRAFGVSPQTLRNMARNDILKRIHDNDIDP